MRSLIVMIAFGGALMASQPVATVDSGIAFTLRGKVVPVSGAGGWAVFPGDSLATQEGAALLTFKDGSNVLVAKESTIQLVEKAGRVSLKVVKGEASFRLKAADSVGLYGVERAPALVGVTRNEKGAVSTVVDAGYFGSQNGASSAALVERMYGEAPWGGTWTNCPDPVSRYHGHPQLPRHPEPPRPPNRDAWH
ncbi:FecR domain-containing protein [Paludibaculum fermentans]|uniref:FecR domain-containing protein n=1 Tax=Paludibaculum fermentans TaxID=1473598 RepID=A0A7S7NMD2_PALFE|nr:FecR domain-containing protein [Paludibaculum fermentans]QOY86251.1 FecR domain-containing protein [Paludibaculum fermentans]